MIIPTLCFAGASICFGIVVLMGIPKSNVYQEIKYTINEMKRKEVLSDEEKHLDRKQSSK